jgi:hypothetical protein
MKAKLQEYPDEFPLGGKIPSFYTENSPADLKFLMDSLIAFARTNPPEGMQFWLDVAAKICHHREEVKRALDATKPKAK